MSLVLVVVVHGVFMRLDGDVLYGTICYGTVGAAAVRGRALGLQEDDASCGAGGTFARE